MSAILTELDSWVTALVLAALMVTGWWIGWRRGQRLAQESREPPANKFSEAILALLGLLLAFSFSMSLAKHDQRRLMLLTESNAIGDFYTSASLTTGRVREKLQGVLREYIEHLLSMTGAPLNESTLQKKLAENQEMHNRMLALVAEAVNSEKGTPVVVPLVNTLNEVTSAHEARLVASRDRVPPSIVVLLFLAAVLATALVGVQQGASADWRPGATIGFIALVSLTVCVTLDLNQPQRGMITVSQEPLQRMLASMGK